MIKLRTLVKICLIVATLLGLFSSCAKKQTDEAITKKASLEQVTLDFYFPGSDVVKEDYIDKETVIKEVEKKTSDLINANLKFHWIEESKYDNEIKKMINAGDKVDAFKPLTDFSIYAEQGFLKDITGLFPEKAPELYKKYEAGELRGVSYKGKLYAVPRIWDGSLRLCILVRDDFMEKYNLPDIKTLEDFELYLDAVKKNEPGIIPLLKTYSINTLFMYANGFLHKWAYFGYKWEDSGMKLVPWEQTKEFKDAMATLARWVNNDYISHSLPGKPDIGSYIINQSNTLNGGRIFAAAGTEARIYYLYPYNIAEKASNRGNSLVFSKNSKNIDRILRLLQWIHENQENYDLFNYGIKDKDYKLDGKKVIFKDTNYSLKWDSFTRSVFSDINYTRPTEIIPKDVLEEYRRMAAKMVKSPLDSGFKPSFDDTTLKILQSRDNLFNELEKEYLEKNFSRNLDTFIKEQQALGTENALKELQSQLDEWKKLYKE